MDYLAAAKGAASRPNATDMISVSTAYALIALVEELRRIRRSPIVVAVGGGGTREEVDLVRRQIEDMMSEGGP